MKYVIRCDRVHDDGRREDCFVVLQSIPVTEPTSVWFMVEVVDSYTMDEKIANIVSESPLKIVRVTYEIKWRYSDGHEAMFFTTQFKDDCILTSDEVNKLQCTS